MRLQAASLLIIGLLNSFFVFGQVNQKNLIVAGFYPYSKSAILKPADISFDKLTHLIYCFAKPEPDGRITTESTVYHNKKLIGMAHEKGCKVIVMIGGGGSHSDGYHAMAASDISRKKFITNLVSWCRTYGYDGVNIDWEYPGNNNRAEDRTNLTLLVKEMRMAFDAERKKTNKTLEISMDVHSMLYHAQWIDYSLLKKYIDWFGLMAYDYSGDWPSSEHASHNAPLYCGPADICNRYLCVDRAFHNLRDSLLIPSSQIVMGVPFYGRKFENKALYETPKKGGEGIAYYDVMALINNGWSRYWDEQSNVPYLLHKDLIGMVSYDDPESLRLKIDYVNNNEIAGIMIWEITQDYDKHSGGQPLLESIHKHVLEKR